MLHEILAIEQPIVGKAKAIMEESLKVFKEKHNLFIGFIRTHKPFDEKEVTLPEETQTITTTVPERLQYTMPFLVEAIDIVFQKEATNQEAKADIVLPNGAVLYSQVPATCLLGLETKLKDIRGLYEAIPTLPPGISWVEDTNAGNNVFKTEHPEIKLRTEMRFKSQVLYNATDKHPAQIEKWQEQVPTGQFEKVTFNGMVTSAKKAEYLKKIDILLEAVKTARQRANSTVITRAGGLGVALANFINS